MAPKPDINTFVIRSEHPEIRFWANYGDGAPLVVDGYGGWSITQRPQDIGVTEWIGRNPMAIEIPFVIDNWLTKVDWPGVETEEMAHRLERLSGVGTHDRPPICIVNGFGVIPHDNFIAPGYHRWVIENVSWDRAMELRSGETQRRLRCGGTIMIRQFIESDPLERQKKERKDKKKHKAHGGHHRPRIYIVKKGDTLSKIAAKFYHDASKWKKIAQANHIRDPRKLKIGQRLRIPAL